MNTGLWKIFKWPTVLALITSVGLVSALVADGFWDGVSWLGLGLPVVVGVWFSLRRQPVAADER